MKWTNEMLQKEAFKYKTRIEFKNGNDSAYQACVRRHIIDEICSHMPEPSNKKYTKIELKEKALKFRSKSEFQKMESGAYCVALKRGILKEICKHMDEIRHNWTNQELEKEALKYKTRGEFKKNSLGYTIAVKRRILDQICSHMPKRIDVSGENGNSFKWSDEMLQKEALLYSTRGEFAKNSLAYDIAYRRGILDQICAHMKFSAGSSFAEKELFDTINKIFISTRTIRDTNVKIKDKPHIKGFDLDIYVPELNKAIEFDGTYWHSVEGLRHSRKHWPQEDIENYHQLKDEWFLSKNIQILHIKESDWNLDKESCIKRCLEFLGV